MDGNPGGGRAVRLIKSVIENRNRNSGGDRGRRVSQGGFTSTQLPLTGEEKPDGLGGIQKNS